MNELALYSGAGGGILATQHILGWRTIGYVDWSAYACEVLQKRMEESHIQEAPIFCVSIQEFIGSGFAACYKGMVDVMSAGFTCQPFSLAGKRKGFDDARETWTPTAEIIRIIRPRSVFLENVPSALYSTGKKAAPVERIAHDLAESGYDPRWDCLPASSFSADHERDRWFCVAHSNSEAFGRDRRRRRIEPPKAIQDELERLRETDLWTESPKSRVGRAADGMAGGLDRLAAIGEGQVPIVVAAAWKALA